MKPSSNHYGHPLQQNSTHVYHTPIRSSWAPNDPLHHNSSASFWFSSSPNLFLFLTRWALNLSSGLQHTNKSKECEKKPEKTNHKYSPCTPESGWVSAICYLS